MRAKDTGFTGEGQSGLGWRHYSALAGVSVAIATVAVVAKRLASMHSSKEAEQSDSTSSAPGGSSGAGPLHPHPAVESYAKAIRDMIAHEDELLNQRMNWLLVVQGLLFAAFGWAREVSVFPYLLGGVGVIISASSWLAFRVGDLAIHELNVVWWEPYLKRVGHDRLDYPPVFGVPETRRKLLRFDSWLSTRRVLPWVFVAAWVAIIVCEAQGCF